METVLRVANLEKVYGQTFSFGLIKKGGAANTTRALAGVSFLVERGEFIAIMGPSGSGKSTLLNCIATIDQASSGQIFIDGQDISSLKKNALADFRRDRLGFIFQDSSLIDTLTCQENIGLSLSIAHAKSSAIDESVKKMARSLGVEDCLTKYPYQISGGQRQRVAAARAMVGNPSLVLADEPTGALDSKNAKNMLESFAKLNTQLRTTILMVTHDAVAASYAKRVLFIKDGKLYTELIRGASERKAFFNKIMDVQVSLGGEMDV